MPASTSVDMEKFVYAGGASPIPVISKDAPHTNAGKFGIPLSFVFTRPSSYLNNMEFRIDPTFGYSKESGPVAIFRDSNKVWALSDYHKYGFDTLDGVGFKEWKAPKPLLGYVERPKFEGLIVARHERPVDFVVNPMYPKYVTDTVAYQGPINEFGKRWTQARSLDHYLHNLDTNKIGEKIAYDFSGFGEDIERLGVIAEEGTIFSIGRLKDGKVVLLRGDNAAEYLSRMADRHFVTLEDVINRGIAEEVIHNIRKSYDIRFRSARELIEEETATKQTLLAIYRGLAETTKNPKLKVKYERIAREIEEDIEDIDRYEEVYNRAEGRKSAKSSYQKNSEDGEEKASEDTGLEDVVEELTEETSTKHAANDNDGEDKMPDYESVDEDYTDEGAEPEASNDNPEPANDGQESQAA